MDSLSRLERMSSPQPLGLKISFRDRHFKETPRETAEYVELEYHEMGRLIWRSVALAQKWEPHIDYDSGSLDCIMVQCTTEVCPWKDHIASIHVYLDKDHRILVLEPHREPMCDHIWARFCSDMDPVFKQHRQGMNLKDSGKGTTERIG